MNIHSQAISDKLIHLLNESAIPFDIDSKKSYQYLSDMIGDARIVLMGESTHGTLEFYQVRMALSQYLIQEKGFKPSPLKAIGQAYIRFIVIAKAKEKQRMH
jgi:erythromycin esterase-like protein